jgi:ubiquitin C-terminal hydrolase
MNTVFQILLHTQELTNILITDRPTQASIKRLEYNIIYYWKDIIQTVCNSKSIPTIHPRSLVQSIHKVCVKYKHPGFGVSQQDASEFLIALMDMFHNAISRSVNIVMSKQYDYSIEELNVECYNRIRKLYSTNYSDIIKTFYGMTLTEIVDPTTFEILSRTFDPYFVLNVSFVNNSSYPSIYDCLDTVFGVETLDKDNQWFNSSTNRYQDVMKQMRLWNLPPVVIINIKKYTPTHKF